jgi:hypothetical protein
LLAALLAWPSDAQPRGPRVPREPPQPPTRPATRPFGPEVTPEFPSVKSVLADRIATLDKDLAGRMMRRGESGGGPGSPILELQIDLRIIQRWMLTQAVAAKPATAAQIALLLRADELAAATAGVEEAVKPGTTPSRSQSDAMAQIHKLSFDIPAELKDVAQLDELCKKLGYSMENVASATPIDARTIPLMRPRPISEGDDGTRESKPKDAGAKSIAELSAEITRATVSIPVRQQLLVIAKLASAPAGSSDPAQQADAASLYQMLVAGVDLAKGISTSSAFSVEARTLIETQLAEGLALFSDSRTRAAGRERVQRLSDYRQVMNRIARGRMSAEARKALGPALAYAQTHAEQGQKLLDVIESYLSACERADALGRRENPAPQLRRPSEDVAKQIDTARAAFVAAANEIGGTTLTVTPEGLENQVAELSALLDLCAVLDGMQQTYDTLNGFKPRPFGAIEQRGQKAALAAASTTKSPSRTEAINFLLDLPKLARLSAVVTQRSMADVPPAVIQAYAGVSMSEFESKCRLMLGELVNQIAAGGEPDRKKIERLRSVGELCDGLRTAMVAEQALATMAPLHKWVDWTITVEQAQALLAPYQKLLSSAFGGFITETPDAVERYLRLRGHFLPLIALLRQDSMLTDQCAALPDGVSADCARLMTPIDNQPFATERYLSYAVSVWVMLADDDPDAGATALDFAMKRLERDVKMKDLVPSTKPAK